MNPRRLVALYPAAWRHRYGEEFLALLEERPPRRIEVLDIVWAALDAHLFPQAPEGRFRMFTRIAGLAAIGAGAALLIGFLGPVVPGISEYTVLVFYVLSIVGLVGIHLRQVTVRPALAWLGFVVMLLGLASGIGFVVLTRIGLIPTGSGEAGYLANIALWIGSAALGAVMLAIRVFPVLVGLALTVGAPLGMIGLLSPNVSASATVLEFFAQLGIVLIALAWLGAGWSLMVAQPEEGVLGPANP